MAQASEKATGTGNTAVPQHGDHDRVAMLSLKADGSPDQHNPEIIGDKEFALEATKRQFREQAVSATDVAERGVATDLGAEEVPQDPEIERLQGVHESAEKSAESAAEKAVETLYTGESTEETGASRRTGGSAKSRS